MASYDGLYIEDEQFWPIYKLAQELRVPVMAHPVSLTPYWKETQRAKTNMLRGEISMLREAAEGEAVFPLKSLHDYKGRIFGDTHSMDRVAVECAAASLGADCIVVGGDYPISPWQAGIGYTLEEIKQTRLSTVDKERILGGNAARILNLDR